MHSITKGSVEPLVVTIGDRFKLIDSLETTDGSPDYLPTYDVRSTELDDEGNDVWLLSDESASATGLSLSCPIDTSSEGFVPGFFYELYCEFTYQSTESTELRVRFGPFIFAVDHPPPPVGS